MIAPILRVTALAVFAGLILFVIPFLLFKVLLFSLVAGIMFFIFARGRFGRGWRGGRPGFERFDAYTIYSEKETLHDQYNNPKQV